jgi:hypothetical protein
MLQQAHRSREHFQTDEAFMSVRVSTAPMRLT